MINRENMIKIGRAGGNTSNRETPDQIGRVGMSAVLVNVNKPRDANVCRALCHNTEFISATYDPQLTRGNKSAIEYKLFGKNTVH